MSTRKPAKQPKTRTVTKRPTRAAGRDMAGRFAKGNRAAAGHVNHRQKLIQRFTEALYQSISDKDIQDVIKTLVKEAKGGNIVAIRELLDRLVGKAALAEPDALDEGKKIVLVKSPLPMPQPKTGDRSND